MRIETFRILIVVLLVGLSVALPELIHDWQLPLSVALIIVLGLPHGATDYALTTVEENPPPQARNWMVFSAYYVGIMVLYAVLWYFLPVFSFYLFIAFTIFHFGQSNWWDISTSLSARSVLTILWGSFVLLSPILFHYGEALPIIEQLLGAQTPRPNLWIRYLIPGLLLNLTVLAILYAGGQGILTHERITLELRRIFLLLVLFLFTPLLIGFALYFALWHSHDAADAQIRFFDAKTDKPFSWLEFGKKALPLTLLAIAGLALWYVGLEQFLTIDWQLSWLFVFISLVSLPHVILMDGFYERLRRLISN